MAQKPLREEHHVVRDVPYSRQLRDPETDEFQGILPDVFVPRPVDSDGLSTAWLECCTEAHTGSEFESARATFIAANRKVGGKAVIAKIQVGRINEAAAQSGRRLRVVSAPLPGYSCHASIRRLPTELDELHQALVSAVEILTP